MYSSVAFRTKKDLLDTSLQKLDPLLKAYLDEYDIDTLSPDQRYQLTDAFCEDDPFADPLVDVPPLKDMKDDILKLIEASRADLVIYMTKATDADTTPIYTILQRLSRIPTMTAHTLKRTGIGVTINKEYFNERLIYMNVILGPID